MQVKFLREKKCLIEFTKFSRQTPSRKKFALYTRRNYNFTVNLQAKIVEE